LILVTVGNATQSFCRLLEAVDTLSGQGFFGEERVFMQTGNSKDFHPEFCDYESFLPMEHFQRMFENSDLIICHGGCGTLLDAVRLGKIPVVMPRRKVYGEHVNDHQLQLTRALAAEGKVIPAYEPEHLPRAIAEARRPGRKPTSSSPSRMRDLVARAIQDLTGQNR